MRPSEFFGVRIFLVALVWGSLSEILWSLSSERLNLQAESLQATSLIHYKASEFYSAHQVNRLNFNLNFSRTIPETTKFLDSPTNDIS
jgi:hypothetical protein